GGPGDLAAAQTLALDAVFLHRRESGCRLCHGRSRPDHDWILHDALHRLFGALAAVYVPGAVGRDVHLLGSESLGSPATTPAPAANRTAGAVPDPTAAIRPAARAVPGPPVWSATLWRLLTAISRRGLRVSRSLQPRKPRPRQDQQASQPRQPALLQYWREPVRTGFRRSVRSSRRCDAPTSSRRRRALIPTARCGRVVPRQRALASRRSGGLLR